MQWMPAITVVDEDGEPFSSVLHAILMRASCPAIPHFGQFVVLQLQEALLSERISPPARR
jgi:hypothetical protein